MTVPDTALITAIKKTSPFYALGAFNLFLKICQI